MLLDFLIHDKILVLASGVAQFVSIQKGGTRIRRGATMSTTIITKLYVNERVILGGERGIRSGYRFTGVVPLS